MCPLYPFVNHTYKPHTKTTNKTIILFHGWGSTVKKYEEFAQQLSKLGFQVIVPEIIYHDSRNKIDNHFLKEVTEEYFWKTIFQSIDEAPIFFEEVNIPKEQVILIGISMGGFIASGIYARYRHFAGLININGSGSFLVSENIFREMDGRPSLSDEEVERFNTYDPKGKRVSSSPVLLMHGEQDKVVSIEGQKDYVDFLLQHHKDVQFHAYSNVNHTFSQEMLADLIKWLKQRYVDLREE